MLVFVRSLLLFASLVLVQAIATGQDPVFSGPQVGEKLAPFQIEQVFDEQAGEKLDLIASADGGPVAIIFVHEMTRPSIALTRIVMQYALQRAQEGLVAGLVFLGDDPTALRGRLTRARHALPKDVPIGISLEGSEGPGAYGLNRKMTLTVVVGKENRTTANFALVQPGVAVDAPKIGAAIAQVLGDEKKPTLAEMGGERYNAAGRMVEVPEFRKLLGPVVRKTQTKEQVEKAAAAVEQHAEQNPAFRRRLGTVAQGLIDAGKLETYGTPTAQEYLKKWAKAYGPKAESERGTKKTE